MDTCAANPKNEENTTIKIEVAAAILVGILKIYIRRGTMKTPPPIPKRPAIKPMTMPMAPPPMIFREVLMAVTSDSTFPEKSILNDAINITQARMAVNS
jgi:hypothetical protein